MSRKKKSKGVKGRAKASSTVGESKPPSSPPGASATNRAGVVFAIVALFGLMLAVILLGPRKPAASTDTGTGGGTAKPKLSDLEGWQRAPERGIDVSPEKDPVLGPMDAPVTLVEFSDFQCPYCKEASGAIEFLVEKYEGKVRLVFKDFPLDKSCNTSLAAQLHPLGCRAAKIAHCAHERGKFWETYDALFKLRDMTPEALDALPEKLGLASPAFSSCVDDEATLKAVQDDIEEGKSLGVGATPTLFVNGRRAPNYWTDSLESIIDYILSSSSS